jgi:hypothetical protein
VNLISLFVVAAEGDPRGDTLQVDGFGMSIGAVSVGLPMACTVDSVHLRYLELVRLAGRHNDVSPYVAPGDDVDALAAATRLDTATVRRRLERLSH